MKGLGLNSEEEWGWKSRLEAQTGKSAEHREVAAEAVRLITFVRRWVLQEKGWAPSMEPWGCYKDEAGRGKGVREGCGHTSGVSIVEDRGAREFQERL